MYGNGTWNDYYDVTKDSYITYKKKREIEQAEIVSNVVSLTKFLLENNKFSDTYHKDTYLVELLGLINATNNKFKKEELKDSVIKLWNSEKEHEMNFELIVDTEIFTNNQLDNFGK